MSEPAYPERAFVLGFDGVPWGKLEGWVSEGHLPSFRRLFEAGAAGPLRSTTPATTALAWPSIFTGVWPDRHGIYAFQKLSPEYTHRMYTARDLDRTALWDLLTPAVVGNVPMTYPAREIDGKLVAGMLTPDTADDGFTHPAHLSDGIEERVPSYRIALDWNDYTDRPEAFAADLADVLEARRELLRYLMDTDDWRLFFFVFTEPDRFQHLRWEEDALLEHYRLLDDALGEVMGYVEERGATLYVVSDHGFGPVEGRVHVNTLLERAGYLVRKRERGTRGLLKRVGLTRERVQGLLDRLDIDDKALVESLPRPVVERVAGGMPGAHELYDVEYAETEAFAHGEGSVYVNSVDRFEEGIVPESEVANLKADLEGLLSSVVDPETGERVLTVYDGADLFPRDPQAPDLVVDSDRYVPKTSLAPSPLQPTEVAASHRHTGVFFAWGPTVEAGATVEDATVVDVAPTVLHGLGEAIPEAMDGRVLDVFAPGSPPATRAPEVTADAAGATGPQTDDGDDHDDHDSDLEDVQERLRGLGYME